MRRPLVLLLAAAPVLASGGEAEGHAATWLGVPLVVWQAVNLVVFLGLLVHFLRKPLARFFAGRRQEIEAALRRAEEDRARAEETVRVLSERLGKLEEELSQIQSRARTEAEAEHATLLSEARRDAERLVERSRAEAESRLRTARNELTVWAGDLAVKLAHEILERNVTPEDQRRLVEEGLAALASPAAPAEPGQKRLG